MRLLLFLVSLLFSLSCLAQETKINPVTLVREGANNTMLITDGSGNVVWGNADDIFNAGTGLSISGNTLVNTSPDQTVAINGTGIISVSGTYPTFTISATEVDGDVTNEIQTLIASGTTSPAFTLSDGGGTITFAGGTGIALSRSGNTFTITNNDTGKVFDFSSADFKEVLTTAKTTITTTGITLSAADCIVFQDGVKREYGSGNDYTFSGANVTFTYQLPVGTKVEIYKQQ